MKNINAKAEHDVVLSVMADTETELDFVCKHCGKPINHTKLMGLSLICPLCGKPQNGHPKNPSDDPYNEITIICKHCQKPFDQVKLRGLSLICPLCGKPQNGHAHQKNEKNHSNYPPVYPLHKPRESGS
ncbi:hypothetical protein JW711_00945 [Candidatus Woesearchaeota archaeon]|nr:hypothetical protein [Candidatus Woesearchaeota archaeon]